MSEWQANFGHISQTPPTWAGKRPVRIALLGDFGAGALRERLDTGTALAKRKPRPVEFDTLEDALARLDLTLDLPLGPEGAPIAIAITELESFHPDELYRNVELFSALSSLRKRLNNPSTFAAAASELQGWAEGAGRTMSSVARHTPARGAAPSAGATLDDFARLTGRKAAAEAGEASVQELLRRVVGPFVVPAANPQKDAMLATVDEGLSDAMRALLHHGDFQNTESLWRGVDFLLRRLETSHQLQVHLIDISAEELAADLSSVDDLADSGLYKLLVEQPGEDADGGYSYIAGCYHFEATPPHAELLGRATRVASHAGAAFITAIAPDVFTDRREPPHRLIREAFQALREMPEASFLGLMAPRFLLRHPYGKKSDPISSFGFEEFSRQGGLRGMLWGHPALLALSVLGQRQNGQLAINDLPFYHFVDKHGDSVALPCTERMLNTDAASMLRTYGVNAVLAHKGQPMVRLAGLEAVNGDGLAAPGTAGKPIPADRVAMGGASSDRIKTDWAPAARSAGTVGVSAPPQALSSDEEALAAEPVAEETPPATAAEETAPAATSEDDELASLLASLEADAPPVEPAAGAEAAPAEPETDPDLEALLKSLE